MKDETLKVIAKINEKNPYYLVIGALVFLLIMDYFLIMRFQLGALSALGPRRLEIADQFRQLESGLSRMDKNQEQILALNEKLASLEKRIKTTNEIPSILEEISRAANQRKVVIEQIIPDTNLGNSVLKMSGGQYYFLPIAIEARSRYHDFARFLNDMEETGVMLKVGQMNISGTADNPRIHRIRVNVQAVIFEPVGSERIRASEELEPARRRKGRK